MIRYRYAEQVDPPAPFVHLTLRCPKTGHRVQDLPALLDYGADRTVIPGQVVEALGLVEDGRASFEGFASEIIELPIFLVEIEIHDLPPQLTRAAIGEREPYILLGRDVLNSLCVLLDGPQRTMLIDPPFAT